MLNVTVCTCTRLQSSLDKLQTNSVPHMQFLAARSRWTNLCPARYAIPRVI